MMQAIIHYLSANWPDITAFIWFMICFNGYMLYTKQMARTTPCLSSVMHQYRLAWMEQMLTREVRVADTTAIANLERSVAFFASASMLIMAGLMTVLGSTETVIDVVSDLPFAIAATRAEWEMKLLLMIGLFIYAFFKFTWSLRQYGFSSVMLGGAPQKGDQPTSREHRAYATRIANMTSMAANNFNLGLRTYYFSLAVLGWFVNPWLFMLLSAGVVIVLYRREFRSNTLHELVVSQPDA
jgi:uncharacterized membrane protein